MLTNSDNIRVNDNSECLPIYPNYKKNDDRQ